MRISVVQDAPILKYILLHKFLWSPKDGKDHLCREGGCRRTLGLRLQHACELDASNGLTGHSAIHHLPTPTSFPFLLECCIYSISSFSINVISFCHSAEVLCILYQPNCACAPVSFNELIPRLDDPCDHLACPSV